MCRNNWFHVLCGKFCLNQWEILIFFAKLNFRITQTKYTVLKNGNRITSGTTDICKELEGDSRGFATALMTFGIPTKCPVQQVEFGFFFLIYSVQNSLHHVISPINSDAQMYEWWEKNQHRQASIIDATCGWKYWC